MPSFFAFHQGNESGARFNNDAAPLLGRFRAVPDQNTLRNKQSVGDLFSSFTGGSVERGSFGGGYGSIWRTRSGGNTTDADGEWDGWGPEEGRLRRWWRIIEDIWIKPQKDAVGLVLDRWWARWLIMVVLPAAVAVIWCAIPFPQYPLDWDDDWDDTGGGDGDQSHIPGHGEARVQVNFWFFLFVFYGFYNITALMWITKVFNIYSLNWWPQSVGFPVTVSFITALSIAAPIPVYYFPETREYLKYNTAWIFWTFGTMAMPVLVAFGILLVNERHLGLRQSLSDTQRIFTQSWWTGENNDDTVAQRRDRRRQADLRSSFDPDANLIMGPDFSAIPQRRAGPIPRAREALGLNKVWIPASFMRFMWFCCALSIGLVAYVLGETYAEIYLRTLPHNNIETIYYVYSWVITIHLLDGLTGWILGGNEGERVGSYPLGWIFKLYFSLTYQTYVRALYARLRSPQQFMLLQLLSSTTLVILHPLTMSPLWHSLLALLGLNTQPYAAYAKFCRRSIFIRTLSENISMLAFLGQIITLHFGANRDVYPYFAFDEWTDGGGVYDFDRTVNLSAITWACEIVAAWVVRRVVALVYGKDVAGDGWGDLRRWPELVPTGAAVIVHVLQNMLFGIIRIRFKDP